MVIKASASTEIRALVDALLHGEEVRREGAVARLAIIGPRAVERLLAAFDATTDRAARVGLLRALEAIADPRALPAGRTALADGGDLALAAIGLLRALLDTSRGDESLDALIAAALDARGERRVRMAALDAVAHLSEAVRAPLAAALAQDPDALVRERLRSNGGESAALEAAWNDALAGRLPDEPRLLRELLDARAAGAPLSGLQRLVDAVGAAEGAAGTGAQRHAWRAVRGAIHQALALRNSRVALYDLRETLERAEDRLPPTFLAAVQVLGDRSMLESIAEALSRAGTRDPAWRGQLVAAFRVIARREKVTRRSPAFKRIAMRRPELAGELGGTPVEGGPGRRTTNRP